MANSRKRYIIAAMVITAAAFYALNVLTPLYADDYSYMFTFAYNEDKLRVTNLVELYYSQLNHYQVMNGRAVAHTLAQLFLMWGKPVFNVINTAAFLALVWAMQALMTGRRGTSLPQWLFALSGLWFLTPAFGQDFLWLTASCTYLYCVLLVLLYLIPWRRTLEGEDRRGAWRALAFLPFGVLAGWTSENAAAAMIGMEVLFIIAFALKKRPVRAWMFTGLAGTLAGFALLIFAPGQTARLEGTGGFGTLTDWLHRALNISRDAFGYLWLPALVFLLLAGLKLRQDRRFAWRDWLAAGIFLLGSLASAYCMVASTMFPARAWSCVVIYTLITVGCLASVCDWTRVSKYLLPGLGITALVVAGVLYAQAVQSIYATNRAVLARDESTAAQKATGATEIWLEPISADNRYNCYEPEGDIHPDSTLWPNTALANYYDVDAVHSTEEGEVTDG